MRLASWVMIAMNRSTKIHWSTFIVITLSNRNVTWDVPLKCPARKSLNKRNRFLTWLLSIATRVAIQKSWSGSKVFTNDKNGFEWRFNATSERRRRRQSLLGADLRHGVMMVHTPTTILLNIHFASTKETCPNTSLDMNRETKFLLIIKHQMTVPGTY